MPSDSERDLDRTLHFEIPQSISDAAKAFDVRATLIIVAGSDIGREIQFSGDEIVLGRSASLQHSIAHPSISRQHCRVSSVDQDGARNYTIADLGSTNGTYVNSVKVEQSNLNNGDRIQIGDVVLKFMLRDADDARLFEEIHRRINYDPQTGLLKLDAFRRALDLEIQRSERDRPFVLAMTDLDGLKAVNDSHGHLAGSYVIETMGRIIREYVGSGNEAGLYGGDEGIILYRRTTIDDAAARSEELRQSFENYEWTFEGKRLPIRISQGLAEWPQHGLISTDLIRAADTALYRAKSEGRNCVRLARN